MNNRTREIQRGDVFYADLSPVKGSEQDGTRPVLVIQNDVGNKYSTTVIIAPITSSIKKKGLPTHVQLPAHAGLPGKSPKRWFSVFARPVLRSSLIPPTISFAEWTP